VDRHQLIKQIQKKRNSKVITYVTSDRPPVAARIAEDAVRPLYDHLTALDSSEKVDLFIYSRGGDVSVPWRIVSMFREFCDEFSVLVPYKAHSAATLLSLGADYIYMGRKAELGPIDPTLYRMGLGESTNPPQEISVEDVNSYISFIKDRANINDQNALSQLVSILANNIGPLTLGSVNRQNSHIRLVAKKLLASRKEKHSEDKMTSIIDTLTEKMYFHGHAIGRREAKELGLPVEYPDADLEKLIWSLYLEYEDCMKFNEPIDPMTALQQSETFHLDDITIAMIESEAKSHKFPLKLDMKKRRQVPPNPQITVNVNLNLLPNISPQQIPENIQGILQQALNQLAQDVQRQTQQELIRQSPEVGVDIRNYGGRWIENREN
jgi:hypothetical protein